MKVAEVASMFSNKVDHWQHQSVIVTGINGWVRVVLHFDSTATMETVWYDDISVREEVSCPNNCNDNGECMYLSIMLVGRLPSKDMECVIVIQVILVKLVHKMGHVNGFLLFLRCFTI
jgi:hypothetical protein